MNGVISLYNYVCRNKKCSVSSVQIRKDEKHEKRKENCKECGKPLYCVGVANAPAYNRFNTLSSSEKKKVLLERSHNHFKKEIAEKKREMTKNLFS